MIQLLAVKPSQINLIDIYIYKKLYGLQKICLVLLHSHSFIIPDKKMKRKRWPYYTNAEKVCNFLYSIRLKDFISISFSFSTITCSLIFRSSKVMISRERENNKKTNFPTWNSKKEHFLPINDLFCADRFFWTERTNQEAAGPFYSNSHKS